MKGKTERLQAEKVCSNVPAICTLVLLEMQGHEGMPDAYGVLPVDVSNTIANFIGYARIEKVYVL